MGLALFLDSHAWGLSSTPCLHICSAPPGDLETSIKSALLH